MTLWEGLIQEYSALVSKDQLYEMYQEAVTIPYGFLYVNMLSQDVDAMFYSGFTDRFQVTEEGAQAGKRVTFRLSPSL